MGLFKIPKRNSTTTQKILDLVENEEVSKPKITLRGTSLSAKIQAIGETVENNLGDEKDNYLLIQTKEEWLEYCMQAVEDGIVSLDTESTSLDNILCDIVGLSLKSPSQKAMYIPIGHISTITEQLLPNQISKEDVKGGLEIIKNCKEIYMHNAYFDRVLLYQQFGIWIPCTFDSLIAANLLNENEPHGLKALHNKYCEHGEGSGHKFAELFGSEIPFCYVPYNIGYVYAARDALLTLELVKFQKPFLTRGTPQCTKYELERVSDVFWNIEMPLTNVLFKMKIRGVEFDFERADELREKYTKLKNEAEIKFNHAVEPLKDKIIYRMKTNKDIVYPINYNSPAQLKVLIYDILESGTIFKKSPFGTGKPVIDTIMAEKKYDGTILRSIVKELSEVKKYDKLISTFIDKLADDAKLHHGKIHCNFNQCGTNTMRMSSSSPNLQQVPSHNDDIRNMFVAGKDRVLVNLDFSQQEMMSVASLADDDKMLESFHKGRDIYSHVASIAFNKKYEECTEFDANGNVQEEGKHLRKLSKAICLGIVYGKGVTAIAEDLHVTKEKAQEIKDSVLGAFPKLKQYLEDVVVFCKQHGYVENFFGCRRRLPDINLPPYEFEFKMELDSKSKEYYTNLYTKKLDSIFKQDDKQKVINDAKYKGIIIKQNGGFIAQAIRNAYNSPVQCLSGDSLILTKERGLSKIADSEGQDITIWDGENFVTAMCMATGKKRCAIIEFWDGRTLKCSLNHQLLTINSRGSKTFKSIETLVSQKYKNTMVQIADNASDFSCINKDDFPIIPLSTGRWNSPIHNQHKYSFESIKDEFDLGYILGWLHSDGSLSAGKDCCWLVAENKYNIKNYIYDVLSKYFKVNVKVVSPEWARKHGKPHAKEEITKFTVNSTLLSKQALAMGVKKYVPRIVMKSKQAMLGYVQACLDSDGTVNLDNVVFTFGKVYFYKPLVLELQQILSTFGMATRIHYCNDRINLVVMKRDLKKFRDNVGCKNNNKKKRLDAVCETVRENSGRYNETTKIKNIIVTNEYIDMYDIVNSESHKFMVNGIITHNCSAAHLTKIAMNNIDNNKRLKELGVYLVLTIHDEVSLSVPKENAFEAVAIAEKEFLGAGKDLKADLRCDIEIAECWAGQSLVFDENNKLVKKE